MTKWKCYRCHDAMTDHRSGYCDDCRKTIEKWSLHGRPLSLMERVVRFLHTITVRP